MADRIHGFTVGQGIAYSIRKNIESQVYFREMLNILESLDKDLAINENSENSTWGVWEMGENIVSYPTFSIAFKHYIERFIERRKTNG